jgi:hypothetical protein
VYSGIQNLGIWTGSKRRERHQWPTVNMECSSTILEHETREKSLVAHQLFFTTSTSELT